MHSTRRAIFSLVALGRVNAAEAERLIALCNQQRNEQIALDRRALPTFVWIV